MGKWGILQPCVTLTAYLIVFSYRINDTTGFNFHALSNISHRQGGFLLIKIIIELHFFNIHVLRTEACIYEN